MSEPTQAGTPQAPNAPENKASPPPAEEAGTNGRRKRVLLGLAAVVLLCGLAWGVYDRLVLAHFEDTDNAYVQGNVVQITPQIGGTVTAIYADETDRVQAGAPLVQLDGADAELALAQAEAALGQTVRQVRTLYANNSALEAQVRLREADVAKARTQLATAEQDVARRQGLAGGGAVSGEELAHARAQVTAAQSSLKAAQAGVSAAQEQLASNQALTDGTPVAQHPSVLAAAAKLREAWLAAHRTLLPAPVSGYVGKRTVQLGQRVAAGTPLLTVVPLGQVWVEANFKENQLRRIHIGQPVRLTADAYGSKVVFNGTISGLGVSTGAASALLPAQNATGNWIKVVQRVPVRIALEPGQLKDHPLRVGLSMLARVDVSDQSGPELTDAARAEPLARTAVFADAGQGAEQRVQQIIARNLGRAAAKGS
ncbi:MAG: efflux RND transporter periplasmic adaptor subunit [Burkholderiaceae bacterium]|nr:efflux RND transporter periplasmic adaptor subunit [Pseudomonadota bacterium]MBS0596188.1 efflux RND transporter periplasmic adaptor subunit [Pseudomonadota bacterium]MCO5115517.1 efflux RND transporter periplasmic adaptor subunit [Burkholderiaceae bacterium]MCP5217998.1 efflux RND transporter periplasmic adaptor subunit [Burkholderiaceae bacterium]